MATETEGRLELQRVEQIEKHDNRWVKGLEQDTACYRIRPSLGYGPA